MYSSVRLSVNGRSRRAAFLVALGALVLAVSTAAGIRGRAQGDRPTIECDEDLSRLFAPAHPQLGRYEVCATPETVTAIAPSWWRIETLAPLDAFGAGGSYDRAALSRLYGSRRVVVARGWTEQPHRFEAVTLISPHPDRSLTRLMPGTLVIRHAIIR